MTPALEISAGGYLRFCREAKGVALAEAARAYAHSPIEARTAELLLDEAERDHVRLGEPGLLRLQKTFAFDLSIYRALADGDIFALSICIACGSARDPDGARCDTCPTEVAA